MEWQSAAGLFMFGQNVSDQLGIGLEDEAQ
jgi:hypothetical protein